MLAAKGVRASRGAQGFLFASQNRGGSPSASPRGGASSSRCRLRFRIAEFRRGRRRRGRLRDRAAEEAAHHSPLKRVARLRFFLALFAVA